MNDELVLVNIFDEKVGEAEKLEAHKEQKLHRAFSIFLYYNEEMLIQKRAEGKYHSANLWSNTCCSHPRVNEELCQAVRRRLKEETGIECLLHEVFSFVYFKEFDNGLSEFEYDHVFLGEYNGDFKINPDEASEMKWINLSELAEDMEQNPENYTTWFLTAAPRVMNMIKMNNHK